MSTRQPVRGTRVVAELTGGNSAITAREFVTLHQSCAKSLDRLYKESQQTLALLLLTAQSPSDPGHQSALGAQRDAEDRARLDYQQRRRELFGFVSQD